MWMNSSSISMIELIKNLNLLAFPYTRSEKKQNINLQVEPKDISLMKLFGFPFNFLLNYLPRKKCFEKNTHKKKVKTKKDTLKQYLDTGECQWFFSR